MNAVREPVTYRSFSQYSDYNKCPQRYYLKRIATDDEGRRLMPAPGAWLPQGTGVHEAVEAVEKSGRTMTVQDAVRVYHQSFEKATRDLITDAPLDQWYWSGMYDPSTDLNRRKALGEDQILAYFQWITDQRSPWVTPEVPCQRPAAVRHALDCERRDGCSCPVTPGHEGPCSTEICGHRPEGELAVELEIKERLGDVEVLVVIDQIALNNRNRLEIIDVKTGRRPGEDFQLATGAALVEERFGVKPESGRFWMARTGKPTPPVAMLDWPKARVADVYSGLDQNIRAERFDPKPDPKECPMCPVAKHCEFARYE